MKAVLDRLTSAMRGMMVGEPGTDHGDMPPHGAHVDMPPHREEAETEEGGARVRTFEGFMGLPELAQARVATFLAPYDLCSLVVTCRRMHALDLWAEAISTYGVTVVKPAGSRRPACCQDFKRGFLKDYTVGQAHLNITWGDVSRYWARPFDLNGWPHPVARLRHVWWLNIDGATPFRLPPTPAGPYHVFLCVFRVSEYASFGNLNRRVWVEGQDEATVDELPILPHQSLPAGSWLWVRLGCAQVPASAEAKVAAAAGGGEVHIYQQPRKTSLRGAHSYAHGAQSSQPQLGRAEAEELEGCDTAAKEGWRLMFHVYDHNSTLKRDVFVSHVEVIPDAFIPPGVDPLTDIWFCSPMVARGRV